ncbi:hypothetical protein HBI24_026940 [Parastagonospora nodorum]|nr:hypothetical protein HBH53_020440 [Parastagonospora nodorum]KAH4022412.1 hypothetical protein HBI13_102280 [Parastagonospora nodorum]KAH4027578.1 hypothetical protein HBI09_140540 [Parastagonospora nodorum]KAH4051258.1 hypothetical protein HBH49_115250 [Parastagonospora nodorum]KAH4121500.1 hypothetical protein HBH47_102710 [Parastagonospora nodorum]
MARLELETIVSSLDVGIKHEAHWESQWPLDTASAKSANTSLKASQLALMETKYPAATLPGPSQHKGVKRKHSTSKLRRTVSFAPEITCRADPNVIDEPHAVRISQEPINFESVDRDFNRRSDDYKPGAHAAPSGQVWAETSFTTYGTEYQDLTNMKVFMTNSLSEFSKMGNDPTDYVNLQHYILGCYHGADTIVDYVNNWSLKAANLSHDSEAELVYLVEESDALVVLIQSGQVLDIRFVSFPDVDDEDPNESEVVDYGQWTSLRECTGIWKPRSFKAAVDETDTDSFRHLFKRLKMSVQ